MESTSQETAISADPLGPGSNETKTVPILRAVLAGVLSGGVALAIGELIASLFAPAPGPVNGVASQVIDRAPAWFINFGKSFLGSADKPALILGTVILSMVFAGLLGALARRHYLAAASGLAAFGLIGFLSVLDNPLGTLGSALVPSIGAVVAGVSTLGALLLAGRETGSPPVALTGGRRRFVVGAAGSLAVTVLGAVAADFLRNRRSAQIAREAVALSPAERAAEVAETIRLASESPVALTPGVSPVVVANQNFYRIDTATLVPQVDPANWSMKVKGMVERELTLTYDDLIKRADWVTPVTLSCVSNEVGGGLVGNAVWQGFPLTDLLDEAGVLPGATQIASRSVDGWDCGFPTELAYDGRTAMLAIAMNGEPLPPEHGFPARLVVSGLYGYVSATKWMSEIELTTIEDFNGFWVPRGWSKLGPVKTQSRIDTPKHRQSFPAGEVVPIAGVAWAPNTGIESVEVRIDEGEWVTARLGDSVSGDSWVQWSTPWAATGGDHLIQVRATDKSGYTQVEQRTQVAPDGATGWHSILITGQ